MAEFVYINSIESDLLVQVGSYFKTVDLSLACNSVIVGIDDSSWCFFPVRVPISVAFVVPVSMGLEIVIHMEHDTKDMFTRLLDLIVQDNINMSMQIKASEPYIDILKSFNFVHLSNDVMNRIPPPLQ